MARPPVGAASHGKVTCTGGRLWPSPCRGNRIRLGPLATQPPTRAADHNRGACREIVYPYIPDPNREDEGAVVSIGTASASASHDYISDSDEEDEGGQASSSLAVSTRWNSAAKLL
ncbi:hypothetical protein BHE74_00007530 [Ensete ventricosum]|uniref:Uncharacterized protein n=1 Tax=Ensete ventricosum TaxID=4639 RepID=A0A444EDP9_ENSVE|nr:hypothetical protein GW17_00028088 [Ensete ventricosum]RWW83929.1 hypothetical protein BHE74_00007530 [Ensete ventricosum]RZR71138.1 hypothetical protein BHM03_00003773 [Ensete ventricosum]